MTVACWFWVRGLRLRSRAAGMSQGGTITEILIGQIRWHGSPSGRKQPRGSSGGGPHHSHLWSCPGRGTGQPEGPEGFGASTPRRGRAELWGLSKCLSLVLEMCRAKPPPGASLGERERGAAAQLWPVVELSTQALKHEQDLAPEPGAGELCGQEPRPQLEVPETPFPPSLEKALRAFHGSAIRAQISGRVLGAALMLGEVARAGGGREGLQRCSGVSLRLRPSKNSSAERLPVPRVWVCPCLATR